MSENLSITVRNADGTSTTSAELPAHLFDVQVNVPLIHQVVVAQQAAARQGTHATKTRADVRGGGAKPWRQKGTGRARQGSRRAPQWTGGGTVHGPQPRSYAQRTPKKMVAAALRGVLSDRVRDERLFVIDSVVTGDVPSTKQALKALEVIGDLRSALVVLHRDDDLGWMSLRNVAHVHAVAVDQINVYDVLVNEGVVFTKAALDAFIAGPQSGKTVKAVATSAEVEEAPVAAEAPEAPAAKASTPVAEKAAKAEKPATTKAAAKAVDADEEAAK